MSNHRFIGLLQQPARYGWLRTVNKVPAGNGEFVLTVTYKTPCGQVTYRETEKDKLNIDLYNFSRSKLRMENFTFDPNIPVEPIPQTRIPYSSKFFFQK